MPAIAFTGQLGNGKTQGMVYYASRWSLAAGGAPIAANFRLNPAFFEQHRRVNPQFKITFLETPDDLVRFVSEGGGLSLWDEAHRILDSRLSLKAQNVFLSQFIMFLRKIGITPLLTFQFERQIDIRLKAILNLLVRCHKVRKPDGRHQYEYDFYNVEYGRPIHVRRNLVDASTASLLHGAYDTYEFSTKLKFPKTEATFEAFMKRVEVAARDARAGRGGRPLQAVLPRSLGAKTGAAETGT